MESLWRQTFSSVFIILSMNNARVFCQNVVTGVPASPLLMDPTKEYSVVNPGYTSPKLMNTLMNVAAAKGVLPEIIPLLQSMPPESQQRPQIYQNVIIQPTGPDYTAAPYAIPPQQAPTFSAVPQLNIVLPNSNGSPPPMASPCYSTPGVATPTSPTFTLPPDLTPVPYLQTVTPQVLIPQSYPFIPPGFVKPVPVLSPQPFNQFETCLPLSPLPEVSLPPPNFQIRALPPVSPVAEVSGTCANTATSDFKSGVVKDGQLPISLQINLPAPSVPAPSITIISPAPLPAPPEQIPTAPSFMGNYYQPYSMLPPYPMPVVIERPRSRLRSWLPILLVALFTRDGGYLEGKGGCCNCCCPCDCGCSNIPIPYPIPIPTNNPIVTSNPYSRSPRKRGSSRDVYDDFNNDED